MVGRIIKVKNTVAQCDAK